ncbi:ABC transporter substrate-binding protein [Pseudomonas sp. GOM6]|uniref:ABC transporter substrate-binding protein n=2 Tax=unclassified Pseudomonas TaxID=196821 RepID=UPI002409B619|nr:ABC transporter substrate-binding protein [Pseudomonas sp. GOM6]MDG1580677.1 ABC transporter substrate-binding protein [Pseudomonas sp. GOM6]
MSKMLRQLLCGFSVSVCLLFCTSLRAEEGVSVGEVRLGMVNAQSGPAAGLGRGVRAGVEAYFHKINVAGGVHGRKLTLSLRDDGYEPQNTARLSQELIDSGEVFALLGFVGTPTSRAAMPGVLAARVPYLFPFTGAKVLREPVHRWVFNVRASYFDEIEALVAGITDDLGFQRVALLMQDDSFGETVKSGLAGALHKRDLTVSAEQRFLRNSLEVGPALQALRASQPQAIFFVGTYRQMAAAVRQARELDMPARFFSVSFVGTEDFIAEAGAAGEGVYISQVVPSPHDASLPLVREYQAAMGRVPRGYASLEGYIDAAVLVEALRRSGPQPTRARLVEVLESLDVDLGGFRVAFAPGDHQGSDAVYLTRVEGGRAVPVQQMR